MYRILAGRRLSTARSSAVVVAVIVSVALVASGGMVMANTGPTARDQSVTTSGEPIEITLDATDPDGDALTYVVVDAPEGGTLSGVAPSYLYTPSSSFDGFDSFTWKAADGLSESNIATVYIKGVVFTAVTAAHSGSDLVSELVVPRPAVDPGDLMWLHVTVTRPEGIDGFLVRDPTVSGWILIRETHVGNVLHTYLFRRVAGVEPSGGYVVRFGLPVFVAAGIGAWSGADTAWFAVSEGTAVAATSVTVPGVWAVPGGRVLGFFGTRGQPLTKPAEMTRRWASFTRQGVRQARSMSVGADEGTVGPIGGRTAKSSEVNTWVGYLISLRPRP